MELNPDHAHTIPKGWTPVPLGSVGKWLSGGTPSMRNQAYWSGDMPWISPKDMKVVRLTDGVDHISLQAVADGARVAPLGAVLVVVRGMILAHSFPVAVADRSLSFNQDIKAVVPTDRVDSDFLLYWLISNAQRLRSLTTESTHGTRRLPMESLFTEIVLLPGMAEQRKVARAIRDMDALIESLEQLLTKKRRLKQGAMQELLTGKKRLPAFESGRGHRQTELGTLPSDWVVATLGAITRKIGSGVTPTGGASRYKLQGRAFVRSQNVGWGELRLDDLAFIDDDTHASFSATELVADDVLLNITGASIGRSALATARVAGGNVNQHVCIVRLDPDEAVPRLINLLLLSDLGQRQISAFQAGGNRQGLNFAQVASMKVPLSRSLLEQEAIAQILADMDSEVTALEAKLTKARQIKQGMMQELLTGRIRLV